MSETISKDILDGVRLLETEFKRNAINGTGGSRMAWEGRAKLAGMIAKEIEADRAEITSLRSQLDEARAPVGYLYHNPDTGTEFSEIHPVESGECDDATDVRPATAEALLNELREAWRAREDVESDYLRRHKDAADRADVIRRQETEIELLRSSLNVTVGTIQAEARAKAIDECRIAVQGLVFLSNFPHPQETLTAADKAIFALLHGNTK